jgi:hypothetical protein
VIAGTLVAASWAQVLAGGSGVFGGGGGFSVACLITVILESMSLSFRVED